MGGGGYEQYRAGVPPPGTAVYCVIRSHVTMLSIASRRSTPDASLLRASSTFPPTHFAQEGSYMIKIARSIKKQFALMKKRL